MRLLVLLAFVAITLFSPGQVEACGGTPPSFTLLTDATGAVPAGTKVLKLYVYGYVLGPTPPKVSLSARAGGLPVSVVVTPRVTAPWLLDVDLGSAAIQAGTSYTLNVADVDDDPANQRDSAQLSFAGVPASPMPRELGQLMIEKRASGQLILGGCNTNDLGEQALIRLQASAGAQPWLRAVKHQLVVDGTPAFEPEMPLVDYVARSNETVIRALASCPGAQNVGEVPYQHAIELRMSAGEHSVKWTSTFPDGTTLETAPIALDLRCTNMPSAPAPTPPCCKTPFPADAGAGAPVGVNVATPVTSGPSPNLGPTGSGTATPVDSGAIDAPSATSRANIALDEPDSVEGCSLGRGQRGGLQAFALFLALFLLHARPERRRRT